MRIRTITKAGFVAGAAMLVATGTAVANESLSYSTGFDGEVISTNETTQWRMSGGYDADIVDVDGNYMLRISNATTSGSFGDMLYSPELAEGATETGAYNIFESTFVLEPVELQPGLTLTMSPDNGSGARSAYLLLEHTEDGLSVISAGANGNATNWNYKTIATGLDPTVQHTVTMKLEKIGSGKNAANNDVFSVRVDEGDWVKNKTFEAYYRAVGADQPEADTMLFRVSGTPADYEGQGFLIDEFEMSVS